MRLSATVGILVPLLLLLLRSGVIVSLILLRLPCCYCFSVTSFASSFQQQPQPRQQERRRRRQSVPVAADPNSRSSSPFHSYSWRLGLAAAASEANISTNSSSSTPPFYIEEEEDVASATAPTSAPTSATTTTATASTTTATATATTPSTRWTGSSRWEKQNGGGVSVGGGGGGGSFLLQEKYGTYFQVPNPHTLFTKIICTLGPQAVSDPTHLHRLMEAGMTAARINMSHGDYDTASVLIDRVREVAKARNRLCPIILDTKGPEIRVVQVDDEDDAAAVATATTTTTTTICFAADKKLESIDLTSGESVALLTTTTTTSSAVVNTPKKSIVVSYEYLAKAVRVGDVVLLDDGRISVMVTSTDQNVVLAQVIEGGVLQNNKGVNLPGCHVDLPHLTEKDKEDILFGVSKRVEYIAHSFTRSATGINQVRELPGVVENGIHIIAKIENQEALDNFVGILQVSDGIMVARGDLGVEIPLERVCSVQKRLVASCNAVGKPVIVATELLDSMINHPRPTRAEASDVANAVFDGADCVMLSGETAVGKYPVEAIQVMTRICKEAELDVASSLRAMAADSSIRASGMSMPGIEKAKGESGALRDAFCKSAILAASETDADLIMAISRTGLTANALAKYFSSVPVMVLSSSPEVCNQVLLHRSVTPYLVDSLERASCVPRAIAKAMELGLVVPGSRVLLLTGKDDMIANRLETFVVGEQGSLPALSL